MNKQFVLALLLSLAVLSYSNTSCPGFNGNDLMQSGNLFLMQAKMQ